MGRWESWKVSVSEEVPEDNMSSTYYFFSEGVNCSFLCSHLKKILSAQVATEWTSTKDWLQIRWHKSIVWGKEELCLWPHECIADLLPCELTYFHCYDVCLVQDNCQLNEQKRKYALCPGEWGVTRDKQAYRSVAVVKPPESFYTHTEYVWSYTKRKRRKNSLLFKESVSCGCSIRHRDGKHLRSKKAVPFIYLRQSGTGATVPWLHWRVYNESFHVAFFLFLFFFLPSFNCSPSNWGLIGGRGHSCLPRE